MEKSRFTEAQIVNVLERHNGGQSIAYLTRGFGITSRIWS